MPEVEALSMDQAAEGIDAIGGLFDDELSEGAPESEDQETGEAQDTDAEDQPTPEGDTDSDEDAEAVEEAEPITLDSLNAVAEHIGVPIEDLMSIPSTFKAAGEDVTATLAEIQQGYARGADYRRQTGELQKEREALQSDFEQRSQGLLQQAEMLGQLSGYLMNIVAGDLNSSEMRALKQTDINKWTAAVTEINTRKEGVLKVQQNLAQMLQQNQAQIEADTADRMEKLAQKEAEALYQKVPDWSQEQDKAVTDALVAHYGYSPEEIVGNIYDHRMLLVARDAMLYRQGKAQEQKTLKKVTKLPKVAKPGKAQAPGAGKSRRAAKAMANHRKTGTVQSAADAIDKLI